MEPPDTTGLQLANDLPRFRPIHNELPFSEKPSPVGSDKNIVITE
jgi:hypothetical protein